jgi:putative ABC transport system permease protein
MGSLLQDLRYGARMLVKNPGFTLVAVLTLSLGLGVNTTIFSYINAILFRILSFHEPERVAFVWSASSGSGSQNPVSIPDYLDWRDKAQSFTGLAAATSATRTMTGSGDPERISSAQVTANFFQVLGVNPARGRALLPDEDRPGAAGVALLSYQFWQKRFGGDPNILNRTVTLDDRSVTVVGVTPANFRFVVEGDIWEPLALDGGRAKEREDRNRRSLMVFGRLKPGATVVQADAEMKSINSRIAEQFPATNAGWSSHVMSARDVLWGPQGKMAFALLLGVVFAVLLIACANVAGLQFARAAARQKEIAIRQALGAGRWRLIRQLLTENLLLAVAGGALGLLLAVWGLSLIEARYGASLELLNTAVVDRRVLAYTMMLALIAALVCGLTPALQFSKPNLTETLKEGGRGGSASRKTNRFRSALVVGEISLALVLLVVAGLMIRTVIAYQLIEPGFDTRNLLTLRVSLPERDYATEQQRRDFFSHVLDRIAAQPGVKSAGAITRLPLRGDSRNARRSLVIEGQTVANANDKPWAIDLVASHSYFAAIGIPLLAGRQFSAQDQADAPRVATISRTMANKYWPNEDPLGKRIRFENSAGGESWITVVGVVGDMRNDDVDAPPLPQIYLPHAQAAVGDLSLVVRTNGAPLEQISAVRRSIGTLDQKLPVYEVATMDKLLFDDLAGVRIVVELLLAFAALALALAAVGIYGVISYAVTQRTGEIGIRLALGAQPRDIQRLIVSQGSKLALSGLAIGLAAALALGQAMRSLLFGVSPSDPLIFIGIVLLLAAVSLLACWIPARRATKVDPMVALKYE